MPYDDDIAFQRAILAAPSDTTLKLVYADWLQDRADPRAEFIRDMVELDSTPFATVRLKRFLQKEHDLDAAWVGFMTTLARPFEPLEIQKYEPHHPFTEQVGLRGRVAVFESQYRSAEAWGEGLIADLAFLTSVEWGECCCGPMVSDMHGFVCELAAPPGPLTARQVLTAIRSADFQSEHIADLDVTSIPYSGYHPGTINDQIHTDFAWQYMFDGHEESAEDAGTHGALKRYVSGSVWYALLHAGGRPCDMVTLLAVGRSPTGNRLVGAITSQCCHNLCD